MGFHEYEEQIEIPEIDPSGLPDNVEELKKRCAELELDNAILPQTVETLKKT